MAETYWQKLAKRIDGYADPATARILEEELSGIVTALQEIPTYCGPANTGGWDTDCERYEARLASIKRLAESALAERGLR